MYNLVIIFFPLPQVLSRARITFRDDLGAGVHEVSSSTLFLSSLSLLVRFSSSVDFPRASRALSGFLHVSSTSRTANRPERALSGARKPIATARVMIPRVLLSAPRSDR